MHVIHIQMLGYSAAATCGLNKHPRYLYYGCNHNIRLARAKGACKI